MPDNLHYTQNFLHNPRLVAELVARAEIIAGDTVLEIGPGKGIITHALAETVTETGRVLAVELDPRLVDMLRAEFDKTPQVEIRHQDVLTLDRSSLDVDYRVFSNVPFNITSELLETLFTEDHAPRDAFLILQTDTLIDLSRDTPTETFKSLLLKPLYDVATLHHFSRTDFKPQPGVDTALFAFSRRDEPLIKAEQVALYKDFLAFVSKDRAGEGVWKKAFTPKGLSSLAEQDGLILARGLKSQTVNAVVASFQRFVADNRKQSLVQGAMASLREEQRRRDAINAAGGHHRSKAKRRR